MLTGLARAARLVIWAFGRLFGDTTFWASLVATLVGVLAAFELERWRDRRLSQEQYARHVSAVRDESARLHAICQQALAAIPHGGLTSYEVDAPALRSLVSGPALQEHAPYDVAVVLGSLLTFVGAASNSLDHYRRLVGPGGTPMLAAHLAPLTDHLTRLQKGIENAQGLMDQELQRLRRGVTRSDEDRKAIAAFTEATKG